jgi:hypothetical protein
MSIDRRRLLQYTGAACALAALPPLAAAGSPLRAYRVQDSVALPRFNAGDVVVADTGVTQFAGAGLYLYPAWGQPRLYAVQAARGRLEFSNPGTGQLLWTQSAGLESAFAGKVLDPAVSAPLLAGLTELAVPRLPTTA